MSDYLWRVAYFTLLQASLSSVLSITLAIPVARGLIRQDSAWVSRVLLRIFSIPLVIPAIAAIFGIIAVYGNEGLFSHFAEMLGFSGINLYGLTGILIAHIFLNFPLVVRLLLISYQNVPYETWRLAASLGLKPMQYWKFIDWPLLRQQLPMIFALVFLLCLTSFAIVLTLGGGPKYATLEVAIFQALRFEFDPHLALMLALLQMVIAFVVLFVAGKKSHFILTGFKLRNTIRRWDGGNKMARITDYLLLFSSALFVIFPLISLSVSGLINASALLKEDIYPVLIRSLFYALGGGSLSAIAAWFLCFVFLKTRSQWLHYCLSILGAASLIISPVMAGSFILILTAGISFSTPALHVSILAIYVFLGLPFALYAFWPSYKKKRVDYDRLCASLPLSLWRRFTKIDIPLLMPAAKRASLYAGLVIFGDFGLVAILGDRRALNLPWYLYDQLGSYRSGPAASVSFLMLIVAYSLVYFAEHSE